MRNLAVAAALVVCAVCLRSGAVPSLNDEADAVLTAASGDILLDDSLGRLSFVSTIFPEATLVFGEAEPATLSVPVSGAALLHAWSETEPYVSWRSSDRRVSASAEGVVMGVYHGNDDELLVEIRHDDGCSTVYGNLAQTALNEGDTVAAGASVGLLRDDALCVFEVLQDGRSVDPAPLLWGGA